jgi:hypothetical protein
MNYDFHVSILYYIRLLFNLPTVENFFAWKWKKEEREGGICG